MKTIDRPKWRREEVSGKESHRKKVVRSRLKWAGHVGRMEGERLTKRAEAIRVEGTRRRGRPKLRWEDYEKRDLAVVGGERIMRGIGVW